MNFEQCSICNTKESPRTTTFDVDGQLICKECFTEKYPDQDTRNRHKITRLLDSTICSFCENDNGDTPLETISQYPVCQSCLIEIKNRTFPNWVKGFIAGILVIVVFSFFWNWKYYQASKQIRETFEFAQKGDYQGASKKINEVSNIVAESEEIIALKNYINGINFLNQDKSIEALRSFKACNKSFFPEDYNIENLILNAQIGASFDAKDYKGFLEDVKTFYKIDSSTANAVSALSSAYASNYAAFGKDEFKKQAQFYLEKARKIDNKDSELLVYYNFIEHRLNTKEILNLKDFKLKYPQGWTK